MIDILYPIIILFKLSILNLWLITLQVNTKLYILFKSDFRFNTKNNGHYEMNIIFLFMKEKFIPLQLSIPNILPTTNPQ